jgi:hypothetical protein
MKKLIVPFLIMFFINRIYCQEKLCIYTELSHNISFYWKDALMYSESDIHLGIQFNTKKGSFAPYLIYRFGGYVHPFRNSIQMIVTPYGLIYSEYYLTPYKFNYSAIGIGWTYRFFNQQKRISPILQFSALTEVKLTKNGPDYYLDRYLKPLNFESYDKDVKYASTVFIGDINIGIDFNIVKNFNINFSVGLGGRAITANFYTIPTPSLHTLYGFNGKLGLSYAFPTNKNKKPEN